MLKSAAGTGAGRNGLERKEKKSIQRISKTCKISWGVAADAGVGTSISMAATSRQLEKATTTTMASQLSHCVGTTSQRTYGQRPKRGGKEGVKEGVKENYRIIFMLLIVIDTRKRAFRNFVKDFFFILFLFIL